MMEANRLGLDCHAMDYNPVAYLIMKATLEYPQKYGAGLSDDVRKYGNELIRMTREELERFFLVNGKRSLSYLWIWSIKCPYCQQRLPLTNHMWLAKTNKKKVGIIVTPIDNLDYVISIKENMSEAEGNAFTQKGGKAICIRCRNSISNDQMSKDIAENKDREMIAVVVHGFKGKEYNLPTEEDRKSFSESSDYLKQLWNNYEKKNWIPFEEIKANRGTQLSL